MAVWFNELEYYIDISRTSKYRESQGGANLHDEDVPVKSQGEGPFLSVKKAAQLLEVSQGHLRHMIMKGHLPGTIRVGRTIRIERAELLSKLRAGWGG